MNTTSKRWTTVQEEIPEEVPQFDVGFPGALPKLEEGQYYWYGPPPAFGVGGDPFMSPAFPPLFQPIAPQLVEACLPSQQPSEPDPVASEPEPTPEPKKPVSALRLLFYWLLLAIGFIVLVLAGILYYYSRILPDPRAMALQHQPPNLRILATNGTFIAERGMRREYVPYDRFPQHLINAVIATEDRRFRYHFGFDPVGTTRAILKNRSSNEIVQGGSTITQQLAKNLFLESKRTLSRKTHELFIALWLEVKFSKKEILELYLNRIYFGSGNYGIGAAAYHYFNKKVEALSLPEAALLVGLIKAPTSLSPRLNREDANERTGVVLKNMLSNSYITQAEYENALAHPAELHRVDPPPPGFEHVIDWITELVPLLVGEVNSNLTVETSLDLDLQRTTDATVKELMNAEGGKLQATQAAVVLLSPDGGVKALFGGMDYAHSQFNRAVKAQRQPGSVFKPFIYLAALESGLTPDSLVDDAPIEVAGWTPENYTSTYRGAIPLKTALAQSSNAAAVRLTQHVGEGNVIGVAHRLGITSRLDVGPSFALGSAEMTLMELTAAYTSFANNGMGVLPYVVVRISDDKGHVLYERNPNEDRRVIPEKHVATMNEMLNAVITSGTGQGAALVDRPAAGKTGTSSGYRDAWFVGYTADYVAGVWVGNDRHTPMKLVTGGSLPTAIWHGVMEKAHIGLPLRPLPGTRIMTPEPKQPNIETTTPQQKQFSSGTSAVNQGTPSAH